MEVILQKDVESLGEAGDLVKVSDGYARNYLLPQNLAEMVTKGALENRERNLARIKAKAEKLHQEALGKADKIRAIGVLEITAKAGESGKLFGAITTKQLAAEILEKSGIDVDRKNIALNKAIHRVGEYDVVVKLASKVSLILPVTVLAETTSYTVTEPETQEEE